MRAHQSQPDDTRRQTLNLWPDTARILGLSRGAIFQAAQRGEIPIIRIGRRLLVPKAALAKLLAAK